MGYWKRITYSKDVNCHLKVTLADYALTNFPALMQLVQARIRFAALLIKTRMV